MRKLNDSALWAAGMLVLVAQLTLNIGLYGQELWPGDINNNGIVNGVDLLYHGVAEGETGPTRTETGTVWKAHSPAPSWTASFIDGTNYNLADANGRGKVDRGDRRALWQKNYGNTHGVLTPDTYVTGDPTTDPILLITPQTSTIEAGQPLILDISLGDATHQVDHFFGIAFTLKFNPDHIVDELDSPLWNPTEIQFDLFQNTWLNGSQSDAAESFIHVNNEAGEIDIVVMRQEAGIASGQGEIASVMIIVEDIAFMEDISTDFTVERIKMVDDNLQVYPVAGSTASVTIMANEIQALMSAGEETAGNVAERISGDENKSDNDGEFSSTIENDDDKIVQMRVYPNPVVDILKVETVDAGDELRSINLYSANGQLLRSELMRAGRGETEAELDVSSLPGGNYFLHLTTANGTVVRQLNK